MHKITDKHLGGEKTDLPTAVKYIWRVLFTLKFNDMKVVFNSLMNLLVQYNACVI